MESSNEKSTATIIHLTTLTQYFIPLGSFIFPLLIWSNKKQESKFVDHHGKEVLNFQLSILLYSILFLIVAIPTFIIWLSSFIDFETIDNCTFKVNEIITSQNITGYAILGFVAIILFFVLKLSELFLILYASAKTSNGEYYKYPLTIPFIR